MNRKEYLFLLSLLFFFTAIRLGESAFLLFSFFFLLFIPAAGFYLSRVKKGLTARIRLSVNRLFPGESLAGEVVIENQSPFPLSSVKISFPIRSSLHLTSEGLKTFPGKEGARIKRVEGEVSLGPKERLPIPFTITAAKRGRYHFLELSLSYGDPFGLWKWEKNFPSEAELLVYPEEIPLSDPAHLLRAPQGERAAKRLILPDLFLSVGSRPYLPGDPYSRIDHKSSARLQSLYTKTYEDTAHGEFALLVNLASSPRAWSIDEGLFERSLSFAAFFSRLSMKKGWRLTLFMNARQGRKEGFSLPSRPGRRQHRQVLEFLARLTPLTPTPFLQSLSEVKRRYPGGTLLVVLTPYVNEEMEEAFRQLVGRGFTIYLMNPGDEMPLLIPWKRGRGTGSYPAGRVARYGQAADQGNLPKGLLRHGEGEWGDMDYWGDRDG